MNIKQISFNEKEMSADSLSCRLFNEYVFCTHGMLQKTVTDYMLKAKGYENFHVGTIEGYPTFDTMLAKLKASGVKKVMLMPFMFVAGDHANNDMAGDEEDSWKTILENEGYEVECVLEGLGQIPAVRDIYMEHVQAAMEKLGE